MATFTFFPDQRIMEVDAPTTEVTVSELISAIAAKMRELLWMEDDEIAVWEGKGELQQVGEYTGITLTFINDWRLRWAARGGPDWVDTLVSGGNLLARQRPTATDPVGAKQKPIAPAAFVAPTIAQAVSPTFSVAQANKQIQIILASLIGTTHIPTGTLYYVDPTNGNDNWTGLLPQQESGTLKGPKKTFAAALNLCVPSQHDSIFLVQSNIGGASILTENIVIDKEDLMVFGAGPGFICRPTDASLPTITIAAPHVQLRSFAVESDGVTAVSAAIDVTENEFLVENMFIRYVNGHGINFRNGCNTWRFIGGYINNCLEAGIHFDEGAGFGAVRGDQGDLYITANKYGIQFADQAPAVTGSIQIRNCTIFNNDLKGIRVGLGYEHCTIAADVEFGANNNGASQPGGPSPDHNIELLESTTSVRRTNENVEGTTIAMGVLSS